LIFASPEFAIGFVVAVMAHVLCSSPSPVRNAAITVTFLITCCHAPYTVRAVTAATTFSGATRRKAIARCCCKSNNGRRFSRTCPTICGSGCRVRKGRQVNRLACCQRSSSGRWAIFTAPPRVSNQASSGRWRSLKLLTLVLSDLSMILRQTTHLASSPPLLGTREGVSE
jgi:hypothetical protein